jgi:hypothetical protein
VSAPIPVLWITGPAGVGKSTVSWQLSTELAEAGVRVAFVDTDQLAMCYPAPPDDLGRERIKARAFGALLPGYAIAGARCVVANGVLDPAMGLDMESIPWADVLICRLRADRDELTGRFTARFTARHQGEDDLRELLAETPLRGQPAAFLDRVTDEAVAQAQALDRTDVPVIRIDTSGRTAAESADLIATSILHNDLEH